MGSLLQSGSLLQAPLARPVAGLSARTISTNQAIQLTDSYVYVDATQGNRAVTLPDSILYSGELRVVAKHQNANLVTLTTLNSNEYMVGPDLPGVTSTTLGPLVSGATFSVLALAPDGNGNWNVTGGARNQTLAVPYGLLSQMQPAAGVPDGQLYVAVDGLAGDGVVYQLQRDRVTRAKKWVALAAGPAFPVVTSLPFITKSGSTLTANPGTWSDPAATPTYQWRRNGVNIAGATSSNYTLVSADYGQPVTVLVTETDPLTGSSTAESLPVTSSLIATLTAAQPVALLTQSGASSTGVLAMTGGAAAPSGPADPALVYLKFPHVIPTQVTEDPCIPLIVENHSVQTPVQPWLINSDGSLFAAASSTIVGGLTMPGATSVTVNAPSGVDFNPNGGELWVPGIGYIEYQSYNPATRVLSGLDSRWAGTVAAGTSIYQVILQRVEPGNTGTQLGATSWGVLNREVPGIPTPDLRIAIQPLVTVEAAGFSCGILAYMA